MSSTRQILARRLDDWIAEFARTSYFSLRRPRSESLQVGMIGVLPGDRLLQLGVDDPVVAGELAARVGPNGSAAIVVEDEPTATRVRSGAIRAHARVDVQVAPLVALPFQDEAFDVVVANEAINPIGMSPLKESLRVLRVGGRIVIIETAGSASSAVSGDDGILQQAGFTAVRVLVERKGRRFVEARKS